MSQPHFSKGSKDAIAFVFSCPGRHEEAAGQPAAGKTGRNLEALLKLLAPLLEIATLTRDQLTITNAWASVEFKGRTGRSEASSADVRLSQNIDRLASELRHVTDLIVFCGVNARLAAQELAKQHLVGAMVRLSFVDHLGDRGLLAITHDVGGGRILSGKLQRNAGRKEPLKSIQAENTLRRLAVVARRLVQNIRQS